MNIKLVESYKMALSESEEHYYEYGDSRISNGKPKIINYILKHDTKYDGHIPKDLSNKKLINTEGIMYSNAYKEIKEFPTAEKLINEVKRGALITLNFESCIYGDLTDIIALYDEYCQSRYVCYVEFYNFNRKIKSKLSEYKNDYTPYIQELACIVLNDNNIYIGNDATNQFANNYNEALSKISTNDFQCKVYYF